MGGRSERFAVFVDGSNFYKGCEEFGIFAYSLDWRLLIHNLSSGRMVTSSFYYDAAARENEKPEHAKRQKRFWAQLRRIKFEIRLGRLEGPPGRIREKGVDVRIATDMLMGAVKDDYDTALLISADGDFSYVVTEVQGLQKRVMVATPGRAHHLSQTADEFKHLDKATLKALLLKQPRRR